MAAVPAPTDLQPLIDGLAQGRFAELEQDALAFVERFPDHAIGWTALGLARTELGRHGDALAALQRSLERSPDDAQVRTYHAHVLKRLGRLLDAEAGYRQALALQPDLAEALQHLGETLHRLQRPAEAEACYRRVTALRPAAADAHNGLGVALKNQGRLIEAEAAYRQALALNPRHADALANLGVVLKRLDRLAEAAACFEQSLALKPQAAGAHSNLGIVRMEQGRMAEAEASLRRALALDPGLADVRSNLLFVLNHLGERGPAETLSEARDYGRRVAAAAPLRFEQWNCTPQPERLRIGLVSGDLREHPVGHFLEALLAPLAAGRVELIAYPTHHRQDALSERIRPRFAAWTPLTGLTDGQAAARIHADGVHVLLDLAGHTAHNRLPLFACKPAPVQASWLGYFASTGVAEMDWLIADETGVPAGHETHFSERIWRLPHTRLCFTPPQGAPAVTPLPALSRGHVTFGCFQSLAKVGDAVLAAWAEILAALPAAKLRLQCKQLGDEAVVQSLRERLHGLGVAPARVDLHRQVPRAAYLAAHAEVDLLLDTFPYPGGTTTCEALVDGRADRDAGRRPPAGAPGREPAARRRPARLGGAGPRRLRGPCDHAGAGPRRPGAAAQWAARAGGPLAAVRRAGFRARAGGRAVGHVDGVQPARQSAQVTQPNCAVSSTTMPKAMRYQAKGVKVWLAM
ncbi:MAG: tetratricopeptide repeat protein [Piscinibacter sp.]